MSNAEQFSAAALKSFRYNVELNRRNLEAAEQDVEALVRVGAFDSFVSTFAEHEHSVLTLMLDRIVSGDEPFSKQLESSSDPLEYTDHNGCAWLFDVRKPHLGWV